MGGDQPRGTGHRLGRALFKAYYLLPVGKMSPPEITLQRTARAINKAKNKVRKGGDETNQEYSGKGGADPALKP